MKLSLARQRFIQEVRQPDEYIDLERAALYIAQETYPALDIEAYVATLDAMAEEVRARLPQEEYPLRTIKTLNQYFFEDLGFHGNQQNYYDPKNSFLNQVIDRRTGIPISLALVYLAVAQRIAFPMAGVGLPGHFLLRPTVQGTDFFIDAFNQGEILFEQDCQERLHTMFQGQLPMQPQFLIPVNNRQFLARMLTNLKTIYLSHGEIENSLATIEKILILFPEAPIELRERGLIYFRLNRWIESRLDLELYLEVQPQADDRHLIEGVLDRIDEIAA
jgi:regulator of sirC expression with transglutaminase-like and TPR domain